MDKREAGLDRPNADPDASSNSSPFGSDTQRYWEQRRSLFSKFDEGIQIDREGLFSVKPEQHALYIAEKLEGRIVLDAFCGVGGSAIAFARSGKTVIAADIHEGRLAMARANAAIYGVSDRISFVLADAVELLRAQKPAYDAVYLDPPWGGPDYYKADRFLLSMFSPDGNLLIDLLTKRTCAYAFTVPNNFDFNEMKQLNGAFAFEWSISDARRLFGTIYAGGGAANPSPLPIDW